MGVWEISVCPDFEHLVANVSELTVLVLTTLKKQHLFIWTPIECTKKVI